MTSCLAGDAAGAVAFHEVLDFGDRDLIVVPENGVLEAGGGHGEIQRLLVVT